MGRRLGKGNGIGEKKAGIRGEENRGKSGSLRQHWYLFALPGLGPTVKVEGSKRNKYLNKQGEGIGREKKIGDDIWKILASLRKRQQTLAADGQGTWRTRRSLRSK